MKPLNDELIHTQFLINHIWLIWPWLEISFKFLHNTLCHKIHEILNFNSTQILILQCCAHNNDKFDFLLINYVDIIEFGWAPKHFQIYPKNSKNCTQLIGNGFGESIAVSVHKKRINTE